MIPLSETLDRTALHQRVLRIHRQSLRLTLTGAVGFTVLTIFAGWAQRFTVSSVACGFAAAVIWSLHLQARRRLQHWQSSRAA
jgi:hypothetical protein